jgi:formylglycine-generating enzyme required for sulfatase activity
MRTLLLSTLLAVGLIGSIDAQDATTDTFGTGDNQFSIDFRTIGNAGNDKDKTGYGSVDYTYRIGTYEISQNQIDAATALGLQNVVAGRDNYTGDLPAANMTWYESAAFVNWLNVSKGFQPAYNLTWSGSTWSMALWTATDAGYNANNLYRNSLAKYFLPSENEFYKAAYGKSDGSGYYLYPTGSDTAPIAVYSGTISGTAVFADFGVNGIRPFAASVYAAGGLSSYGTMGQGGNVWEWNESAHDGGNNSAAEARSVIGGVHTWPVNYLQSSERNSFYPDYVYYPIGLRVASVTDVGAIPEPSTHALFGVGVGGILLAVRRKRLC